VEFKQPVRPQAPRPEPRAPEPSPEPKRARSPLFRSKYFRIVAIALGAVILALISWALVSAYDAQHSSGVNPEFRAVLPRNKSIDELGGWTRISPPNNEPVYAYTDKIGNTAITVSEQLLPDSFANTGIADLAKQFNATNKLEGLTTEVYYGTSAKGPQSVIFAKNELLILIKSQAKISDEAWVVYIKSLN
jgi:hypothetical protein